MERSVAPFIIEPIMDPAVLERCAHILTEAYNAAPWNDNWTKEVALEKLLTFFHSPKFLGWVVRQNDEIIGACVGNIEPYYTGDYFYLKEMFVSPNAQHQGIGKQLMKIVCKELDALDIKMVILFTGNDKFPWNFYLKSGFVEMEGMRMMMLDSSDSSEQ